MDPRHLYSQCNSIKDDDAIKLLLAYIKNLQNTPEVETSTSYKIVISIKGVVGRKKVDVSIKKIIYEIG